MRIASHIRRASRRAGFSQAEVLVCSLLVGLVLVAAMSSVGAILRGRLATDDSVSAQQLANQLMAEILENAYLEPVTAAGFGRESSEAASRRSLWDDVDDYHLLSESPPANRFGVVLPNTTGWQRDVTVEWVSPTNPATTVSFDQGVKRITVSVLRNGAVVAREVALRTDEYTGDVP